MIVSIPLLLFIFFCCVETINSFTLYKRTCIEYQHSQTKTVQLSRSSSFILSSKADNNDDDDELWELLVHEKDNAVKKLILQDGNGPIPSEGSNIEISYSGKLAGSQKQWSVDDVIETWLQYQQGLYDLLEEPFRKSHVDGQTLMDKTRFTEEFVSSTLGISNKMQCKKTVMATKRLWKQIEEFPEGFEFDNSVERGRNFKFVLGSGKAIKGIDVAVSTMKVGEKARIFCRSDYAYGSEGYRTKTGDVVVPPFRSLIFDIELISASD